MWVRIDDQVPSHPKFMKAGRDASWFWVCGNCYCSKYLTDGFIPEHALPALSPGAPYRRLAGLLVNSGLWEETTGGYRVHDYHDYNPTADDVRRLRAERAELGRRGGLAKAVANRQQIAKPPGKQIASGPLGVGYEHVSSKTVAHPVPSRSRPDPKPEPELALDACWAEFQAEYPPERRQGGFMAERGFMAAVEKFPGGYAGLLERLRQHKRSEQWGLGKIPNMRKWFEEELWRQELPAPKPAEVGETMDQILERRKAMWAGRD